MNGDTQFAGPDERDEQPLGPVASFMVNAVIFLACAASAGLIGYWVLG